MMPGKRALVVDDSRSARVVLSRMLERYGILVDSAESAEAALEYLKDRRPDVIFMDHLMPGMDGLQAVREIKANPGLADIPIMMYTSQEGEIYSGQARASGAIGVLPKSIRPIDVTKALYQLKLLPDRRDGEPTALEPVGVPAEGAVQAAPVPASVEALLKEQNLELRKFVVTSLDAVVRRVVSELRPRESVVVEGDEDAMPAGPAPSRPWPWMVATGAAVAALAALAILYWQARVEARQAERAVEALTASNDTLTKAIEKWRIAGEASADAAAQDGFRPLVLAIPFGERRYVVRLDRERNAVVVGDVADLETGAIRVEGVVQLHAAIFASPRQFGPQTRTPLSRAIDRNSRCRATPSSVPSSAKPAEMISAERAPMATLSLNAGSTWSAATMIAARSTGSGMSRTDR